MLKIAGANVARLTVCAALTWPFRVAVSVVCDCPANSHGTCKLTCPVLAKNSGASTPSPNCKESPERLVGSGGLLPVAGAASRKSPNAAAMLPAATGAV